MIKCNVTVCGTIGRIPVVRAGREGKQFTTFGVNVQIPVKNAANKLVEVSVIQDGGLNTETSGLTIGTRVEVVGVLTFKKRGEALYLNLNVASITQVGAEKPDSIQGDMHFRGKLGKTIEMKQDKKGNAYLAFSAFSAEKVGEEFAFTWVRFVRFAPDREDWLVEKANIEAKGQLELSVYNDKLNIGCRLSELAKWEKQPYCPF